MPISRVIFNFESVRIDNIRRLAQNIQKEHNLVGKVIFGENSLVKFGKSDRGTSHKKQLGCMKFYNKDQLSDHIARS
jgi:hypothetical protein